MKIVYIFKTNMASTFQLSTMILPQLEKAIHGAQVVGMFFFDENLYVLRKGHEIGERLNTIAKLQNILIMACDQCAVRRNMATGTLEMCGSGTLIPKDMIEVARIGCFPQLYSALSNNPPDLIITL